MSPVATCAGGLFPSTHWRTYSTFVRATCTVWYILYNNVFGRANVTIPSRYTSRTVNTAFSTEDCILVGLINLFSEVQDQDCLNYFLFLGCLATYAPCPSFMTLWPLLWPYLGISWTCSQECSSLVRKWCHAPLCISSINTCVNLSSSVNTSLY